MPPTVTNAYEAVMNELRTRLALSPVHRDVWTLRATGKHTRTEITTALKHMLAHAHSEYEGMPKCWPCALARKAVEGQLTTSSRDSPMRKPCSIILGELCKRIINDASSSPSIKRGACIAAHTLCLAASKVDAATGRTLTLALAATIIPQLAHQVSGKYPAMIKRIISDAVSPSDQDPQHAGQPELGALFLRLASNTPLANLPDTNRAYVLNIIREKVSLAPNSLGPGQLRYTI